LRFLAALATMLALAGSAAAQLPRVPLAPGVEVPSLGPVLGDVGGVIGGLADPRALADSRLLRLRDLVRANPRDLALDPGGAPVIRDEVLAVAVSPQALTRAQAAGFRVLRSETLEGLDLAISVLTPPSGMNPTEAVRRLRKLDPAGQYDFNHLYFGAGETTGPSPQAPRPGSARRASRIGMIDTGLDPTQPALRGVAIEQRGFAPGGVKPAAHGAAVASLIAGRVGGFSGSAPGSALYVADVYGAGPRGGSAEAVVRAFAWLAQSDVQVINVSLVGPSNAALQAAVGASQRRGANVVAAVGNDGPAAPPMYPASYPGVVAVTGVDSRDRVLVEAGRAAHVDFAAPGANILAADGKGGLVTVRGTSFAAPLVAGRLAQLRADLGRDAAVEALGHQARDLGAKGPDKVFGRGLVGEDVRLTVRR